MEVSKGFDAATNFDFCGTRQTNPDYLHTHICDLFSVSILVFHLTSQNRNCTGSRSSKREERKRGYPDNSMILPFSMLINPGKYQKLCAAGTKQRKAVKVEREKI